MEKVFETRTITAVGDVLQGTAHIDAVTSDIAEAVDGAEIILVAVPAFAHKDYAELLASHVREDQVVALLPGTLGSLEFARIWRAAGLAEGVILAEADTLPVGGLKVWSRRLMSRARRSSLGCTRSASVSRKQASPTGIRLAVTRTTVFPDERPREVVPLPPAAVYSLLNCASRDAGTCRFVTGR